jgi:hypothetical protein
MDETDEQFLEWIDERVATATSVTDRAGWIAFKVETLEKMRRAAEPSEPVALSTVLGVLDAVWN